MHNIILMAQQTAAAAPAAGNAAQGGIFGSLGPFFPMILLFGIFYLVLIRPQQRKEKERLRMIKELRAGQKVIFAGGLCGTILEAKEKTFIIELSSGNSVEVIRSAVSQIAEL